MSDSAPSPASVPNFSDGLRIGYARVSTADQTLEPQLDALRQAGCAEIYSEHVSGAKAERRELALALRTLRKGDTLVVCSLDRLGRSLPHLIETVNDLAKRAVRFESLREQIDTGSAAGALIFHLFASFAEFERTLLVERTKAGLASARARGRKGGRPPALTPKQIRMAARMMADPEASPTEIARQLNVSRSTLYESLRRHNLAITADPASQTTSDRTSKSAGPDS